MKRFLILLALIASGWLIAQNSDGFGPEELAVTAPAVAAAGGGGGSSATDTANRTDSSPIDSPMSDGVSTWDSGPGGLNNINIVGNVFVGASSTSGARVATPSIAADQYSQVEREADANGFGAGVRCDANGNGYLAYMDGAASVTFFKVSGNGTVFTEITPWVSVTALADGDTLKLTATGTSTTTLELFRNGVSITTRTDSTSPYTSGQPWVYLSSGVTADNFTGGPL